MKQIGIIFILSIGGILFFYKLFGNLFFSSFFFGVFLIAAGSGERKWNRRKGEYEYVNETPPVTLVGIIITFLAVVIAVLF